MSRITDSYKVKMTFYPMVGGVFEQFGNLLLTLQWLDTNQPSPREVHKWFQEKFGLSHYFARDVYTVLFISSGLIKVHNERCFLTSDGKIVLATSSPAILLEVFEKSFAGVASFLEILRSRTHISADELKSTWFELVKERFPTMKVWSKRTLNNQCRHRIDWLRAMGFITVSDGRFLLSESGWQFVIQYPPEAIAIQQHEIKQQEKQIGSLSLDQFQPFDTSNKNLSLRQVLVRDFAFRTIVSTQYRYQCAVCEFRLRSPRGTYEAEAAHIIPKRKQGTDDPRNGVSLCGICHWAFDEGIITVQSENLSIIAAKYLRDNIEDESVRRVIQFHGKQILSVVNPNYAPSTEALIWHNQNIFLG